MMRFMPLFVLSLVPLAVPAAADVPTPTCDGLDATIVGTPGDDVISGTPSDDVIVALGGADAVFGGAGDDVICAGSGDDEIRGGMGDDVIVGGSGADLVFGGPGDDLIRGGAGDDLVDGGRGRDVIVGRTGDDTLHGRGARDHLFGGAGFDIADGGGGGDECRHTEWRIGCERPLPADPGDAVNCTDFATWREAQIWFDRYFVAYGDVAHLDNDRDGVACETRPGAPQPVPPVRVRRPPTP